MAGHASRFFLAYPVANIAADPTKQLINWVCCLRTRTEDACDTTPPERASWTLKAGQESPLHTVFNTWSFGFLDVCDVIKGTKTVWEFPMSDRDPLPAWTHSRVTLIGDAAHPKYPLGAMARLNLYSTRRIWLSTCKVQQKSPRRSQPMRMIAETSRQTWS